jgi:hypothetical protein
MIRNIILAMLVIILTLNAHSVANISRELRSIRWRLDAISRDTMLMHVCTFRESKKFCDEATPGSQ